ncbi:MAG: hypothetical protein ACRDPY_12360 [Streptosporangiaceae bacterium]
MSEVRALSWGKRARPAIGTSGKLPRRVIIGRSAVALALVLLLGAAKLLVSHLVVTPVTLSAPDYVITAGLDIGEAPDDADMQEMATSFRVVAIVNLDSPNVAEQATAASLHQNYLLLPVTPGMAPSLAQLRVMASFMRTNTAHGGSVFVHDDVGGGRAVATAAMLLLLRGEAWPKVTAQLTEADLQALSAGQLVAINQLSSALRRPGSRSPANPYAAARIDRW